MLCPTSPRLPGVPILVADVTGSEYARWRRSIQFALEIEDTWRHCNGTCPMPMPEAGLNPISPLTSTSTPQPSLLQERREWVRKDREAKLDIFLSLADEVMQEVFQVGPPLPPSNLTAKEMLDALDERFAVFRFEDYHHAFCYFLNLHIDQYATLEEFNTEFQASLDDMLDYGCPLSNTQACSAYFSKLRCTQNPWVAKKLEQWDAQLSEPEIVDLIKESPPWAVVRSLSSKTIRTARTDSIPEECFESLIQFDNEGAVSRRSNASTLSTISSHSNQTAGTAARSQEIAVHASEDVGLSDFASEELADIDATDFPKVPTFTAIQSQEPTGARQSVLLMQHPIPIDRPLPPLPVSYDKETRKSTNQPPIAAASPQSSSQISLALPIQNPPQPTPTPAPQPSKLKLETTHPTLWAKSTNSEIPHDPPRTRSAFDKEIQSPDALHPALRSTPPHTAPLPAYKFPIFSPSASSPNLHIPWPSTPTHPDRTHTSLSLSHNDDNNRLHHHHPLFHFESANSSILSLPLQGTREALAPSKSPTMTITNSPPNTSHSHSHTHTHTSTFQSIGIPRCMTPSELPPSSTPETSCPQSQSQSQSQPRSRTSTFDTLRSHTPTFESLRRLRSKSPISDGASGEAKAARKRDRKRSWGFGVSVAAALKGGKMRVEE